MADSTISKFENIDKKLSVFEKLTAMEGKIAQNLKILRSEQKISQKDLAEKLNVSFKTISHWESGYSQPSLELLTMLRDFFNTTYEDLLD